MEASMHTMVLTSFLIAGLTGGLGYHQITWSAPHTVFGAPRSPSTVPLDKWAETYRMGELAWSLSGDEVVAAGGLQGFGGLSNVVAERSE
jgi:hypothetical protein